MKTEFAASVGAAVFCHALLLFGIRLGSPARPLALNDDFSPVDVSLVEAAPAPPPPAAEPEPTLEPPMPAPSPAIFAPAPEPAPSLKEDPMFLPAPKSLRVKTKPHFPAQTHSRNVSPASSTALSNLTNPGGAANGRLSSHARYRSNPKPDYPPDALQQREEGLVLLTVDVTADGRASNVTLKRSSGYTSLDQAAIRGVRLWIFDPARVAGLPIASRVDVPVRFFLSESSR